MDDCFLIDIPCDPGSPAEVEAYFDGMKDGIRTWAHWNDGVQYVGSCGTTLREALAQVESMRIEKMR